jgi:hypothetical protein
MSHILTFGLKEPDVGVVQQRLNCNNPTRLPRLSMDNVYGVFTMARVMEFQFQKHILVDGQCGPGTQGQLATGPATCVNPLPARGRCILADLINNRLTAFEDGNTKLRISPIHGGSAADPSTRGVFQMTSRRLRHHTSSKFPIPPYNMQFALFYNGAEAIHMGPPTLPSHGCIHVGPPDAERLFNFAGSNDILVIVVKRTH